MPKNPFHYDEAMYDYLQAVSLREPELLKRLRDETSQLKQSNMQISPDQGQFMGLLAKIMGASRCLEIGTFTGYSSLSVALALPADGSLVCCDVSDEWTSIARRYWAEAGVDDKIQLRLGPAAETLDDLLERGQAGSFDFAFIDADKTGYDTYYERTLKLLRTGGLMAFDNVFMGGRVIDTSATNDSLEAMRALNRKLHTDDRIDLSMIAVGDGLTLARKR